jgi:hypothetical protein
LSLSVAIGIGLVLLLGLFFLGRARGVGFGVSRPWFTGFWALATAVNLYVNVAFLRYSFADQLPLFLAAAVVPIAAAYVLPWLFARRRAPGSKPR